VAVVASDGLVLFPVYPELFVKKKISAAVLLVVAKISPAEKEVVAAVASPGFDEIGNMPVGKEGEPQTAKTRKAREKDDENKASLDGDSCSRYPPTT